MIKTMNNKMAKMHIYQQLKIKIKKQTKKQAKESRRTETESWTWESILMVAR